MGKKARQRRRNAQRRQALRERELDAVVVAAAAQLEAMTAAAVDPATAPGEAARRILDFYDGAAVDVGFPGMIKREASPERARDIAHALLELGEGVVALTFAETLTDDDDEAIRLLEKAASIDASPEVETRLADSYVAAGKLAKALLLLDAVCADHPHYAESQCVRADVLDIVADRLETLDGDCTCGSGKPYAKCCRPIEARSLESFLNPAMLYELREWLLEYSHLERFSAWHERAEREWLLGREWPLDPSAYEAQYRFAIERGWLAIPARHDQSILELFAEDRSVPGQICRRARDWSDYAHYGIWQIDEEDGPAVYLLDLLTGAHVHAAVPPEYLEGTDPGSAFLCGMIPVDGVWRPSGALFRLDPMEADAIRDDLFDIARRDAASVDVRMVEALRDWDGDELELEDPLAAFLSIVVVAHLPEIGARILARAERPPEIRNTDGDPMLLHRVRMRVPGIRALEHPDVEIEGREIRWWGRKLTPEERKEQKAWAKREGIPAVIDKDQRWLRGTFVLEDDELHGELNSERRMNDWQTLLREAGLEPEILDVTRIDPAQDLVWER